MDRQHPILRLEEAWNQITLAHRDGRTPDKETKQLDEMADELWNIRKSIKEQQNEQNND